MTPPSRATRSPRPESNRTLPITKRALGLSSCEGVAPAEGVEPSSNRLTAGCLAIRPRWNDPATSPTKLTGPVAGLIGAKFSKSRARYRAHVRLRRVPSERGSPATMAKPRFREASSGRRIRTCATEVRAQCPAARRARNIGAADRGGSGGI